MTSRPMVRRVSNLVVIIGLIAACGPATGSPDPATPSASATTPATTATTATASLGPSSSPSTSTVVATPDPSLPPDATLAADGGDAVTGQLGSFIWGDGGSDSGTLPGAPVAVGASEPLTIGLVPLTGVATWAAALTRIDPDGTGVAPIGIEEGPPPMTLTAPGAGTWRLVVTVRFADHAGSATYTWRLDVR